MAHPPVTPPPSLPMPVHRLPVELLENIFSYACMGGGSTGRSLSLVSAHFREVARPIRFRCVSLSSLRHIKSFLACLTRERSHTKVRVRHLFLSTWRDGEDVVRIRTGRVPRSGILGNPGPRDGPRWSVWMPVQEALDRELSHLIPFLLRAIASNLCTLSIVHSWEFGAIQLPESFPLLRQFTFCGPAPMFPGGCPRLRPPPSPCFPSLQHLHIVCGTVSIEFWLHHSPAVTHLRLSDLNCASGTLVEELRCSLGIPLGRPLPERSSRPPFAHVRLQPRAAVSPEYYQTSTVEHNTFVEHLKSLRPHPSVRVEVMRDRHYRDGYWDLRIHRDWQDGVVSSPGWWVGGEELEEEENELYSNLDGDGHNLETPEKTITFWV
ncbi:hypothetical protein GSI_01167 [Ganoderma sinense ZZ0214-1]|uniref:F-box domain-containing protein n=1 Tax=Ganoderma sinense ZZ0214-1 TaxID=1077348 RepID=A0A2G8SUS4_9APHY|nr:hypothetical protein GSI_01167 [Ganoderma sinense ZZ0214-1]